MAFIYVSLFQVMKTKKLSIYSFIKKKKPTYLSINNVFMEYPCFLKQFTRKSGSVLHFCCLASQKTARFSTPPPGAMQCVVTHCGASGKLHCILKKGCVPMLAEEFSPLAPTVSGSLPHFGSGQGLSPVLFLLFSSSWAPPQAPSVYLTGRKRTGPWNQLPGL